MIKWILFLLYVVVTIFLAWLGNKKTKSLDSFAVGNREMSPWVVAFALAATMTSTATFVINPGIVYAFGFSAVMGYGVAAGLGLFLGIVILSKGFRKLGYQSNALTVPEWIGQRYDDQNFTLIYAAVNLLLIAMVVLIAYGSAILIDFTLGLVNYFPIYHFEISLAFIIVFVFTYIMFGGTYAHAYTNTAQGVVMLVIAIVLIVSGLPYFKDGLLSALATENPVLAHAINPQSLLFRNFFEVFIANFIVGFALTVQPHFLIKSLYVKSDRDVNKYLTIAICMGILFSLVLLIGLFARIKFGPEHLANVDQVATFYIVQTFSPTVAVIISIALLAAAMSTLDGILVALSAIIANDFYLVLRRKQLNDVSRSDQLTLALKVSKYSLVFLGIIAYVLAYFQHYYKEFSVAIFAQTWIYTLFNATFIPLLFGMFDKQVNKWIVLFASGVSVAVHIIFRYGKISILSSVINIPGLGAVGDFTNPGLTAAYGLISGLAVMSFYYLWVYIKTDSKGK